MSPRPYLPCSDIGTELCPGEQRDLAAPMTTRSKGRPPAVRTSSIVLQTNRPTTSRVKSGVAIGSGTRDAVSLQPLYKGAARHIQQSRSARLAPGALFEDIDDPLPFRDLGRRQVR